MTTWNSLRISLVQQASGLEPSANRELLAELTPSGSDLVVFPEVFARDFGKPGSDLSPYAESVNGAFGTELARVAKERGATVVAGMLERTASLPYNTLIVRGRVWGEYRKIHLYDSFSYRESDVLAAGEQLAGARQIALGLFEIGPGLRDRGLDLIHLQAGENLPRRDGVPGPYINFTDYAADLKREGRLRFVCENA